MEEDEAAHPIEVALLDAVGIMFEAHNLACMIEQFR